MCSDASARAGQQLRRLHVLTFIAYLIVVGIVAGYLARLLVPGRDPMSFVQTVILGVIGSFIGAVIALLIWRAISTERGARA
jgi:uncharacterized membrane protein YeaQ/YmgE (transglycosylase-associated protein family)